MKLLAMGAHPDDIEFGCAPLLLLEKQAGNDIHLLVLSRGEAGSSGTPEQREAEARQAAALMGASIEFLDFHGDCHLAASPANAIRIAAEIRRARPQLVLAPEPDLNQHPDHAAAGRMARDACRLARYAGLVDLNTQPPHAVTALYFYDITRHGVRPPEVVADIGGVVEAWRAVMQCHASQMKTKNYVELQLSAARLLGLSIGVNFACVVYANDPVRVERLSALTQSSRSF